MLELPGECMATGDKMNEEDRRQKTKTKNNCLAQTQTFPNRANF